MPLHRLGTLKEVPSSDFLNDSKGEGSSKGHGIPRTATRSPPPLRHFDPRIDNNNGSADDLRNENDNAEEELRRRQRQVPPPTWAAEPRNDAPRNPLLRRPQWNPKK